MIEGANRKEDAGKADTEDSSGTRPDLYLHNLEASHIGTIIHIQWVNK